MVMKCRASESAINFCRNNLITLMGMPEPIAIDASILEAALIGLAHQKSEIEAKTGAVRRMLRSLPASNFAGVPLTGGKRMMSAATRKRMAAGQRRRWAALKKVKEAPATKRTMSAAARKRIAEASRKRWAAFRAKKTAGTRSS